MTEFVEVIKVVGLVFGPAGAAWYSVKYTLNGTVARVQRIEETVGDIRERVAAVEAKID